jgi:hypothetical protein
LGFFLKARNAVTVFQSSKLFARLTRVSIKLKYSDESKNDDEVIDVALFDIPVNGRCCCCEDGISLDRKIVDRHAWARN